MGHWSRYIAAGVLMMLHAGAQAATALGEINIEMSGNIVDFTCVAEGNDSDKVVTLGTADETAKNHGEPHAAHAVYAEADRLSSWRSLHYVFGKSRRQRQWFAGAQ